MAGIGFRLRALTRQEGLLAPLASIGHAAMIAAGPWLLTVVALAVIDLITNAAIATSLLQGFRLVVIYAFAISLLATTPIVIVATRLVGDAIYAHSYAWIRSLFAATLLMSGGAALAASLLAHGLVFRVEFPLTISGSSCCTVVGLIWVALAFCGAVRDYRGITLGFLLGMSVASAGTIAAALAGGGVEGMLWAFEAGLLIVFCALAGRVLATFPHPVTDLAKSMRLLGAGLRRFWRLAAGGLLSATGIWIDKWVIWGGPEGRMHETGLVHAPIYDSAMFVACLAVIPALSMFVTHIETTFFEKYTHYYGAIRGHATLRRIEENARSLEDVTMRTLTQIIVVQMTLCAIVALAAPSVVAATGLQYQQVGILRLGVLGAVFQFVFVSSTSLLLFFERYVHFCMLQGVFTALSAGLTFVTVRLGPDYYGFGYLIACVAGGLIALAALVHTMRNLTFVTFVARSARHAGAMDSASLLWKQGSSG